MAQEKFFYGGFCVEFLGMHHRGLMEAASAWRKNVHGFFNLLALEIWGRLFFLGETEEALTKRFKSGLGPGRGYIIRTIARGEVADREIAK